MVSQRKIIPSDPAPLRLAPTRASIEHRPSKRPTAENLRFVTLERVGRCRIVSRNEKFYVRFYEPASPNGSTAQGETQRGRQPCVGPFADIEQARAKAREIDASLNTCGTSGITPSVVPLQETVHILLTQLASDPCCSPDTARNYRARWRYVLEYAEETQAKVLRDLTADHARDFERWLAGRLVSRNGHPNAPRYPLSPGHQRNILEAARTLWEKARLLGHVPATSLCPFQPRTRGRRANVVQFPGFEDRKIEKTIIHDFPGPNESTDRGKPLNRTRNLDQHIGTIHCSPEAPRLGNGPLGIVRQVWVDFQAYKAVPPFGVLVEGAKQVRRPLDVLDGQDSIVAALPSSSAMTGLFGSAQTAIATLHTDRRKHDLPQLIFAGAK